MKTNSNNFIMFGKLCYLNPLNILNNLPLIAIIWFCTFNNPQSLLGQIGEECEAFFPISERCIEQYEPIFEGGSTLCDLYSVFVADFIIPNGTLASNLNYTLWPLNSSVFNNDEILIQGTFYIDEPVAFNNCRIKFSPGAQIIISSPLGKNDMLAYNTKFFSCETMWKGINVLQGSRVTLAYCKIEDAQYALTVHKNTSINLIRNTFNRNYVGITNASDNPTLPLLLLKFNKFDCTSPVNEYYNLPYNTEDNPVSYAGILLNDCSSSIGAYSANNLFTNLSFGIVAFNSSANIKGCRFTNTQFNTFLWPEIITSKYGHAIFSINSTISVLGESSLTKSCSFKNTNIISEQSNMFFTFADFEDVGINTRESYNAETVLFEDNEFNDFISHSTGDWPWLSLLIWRSAASGETETHTSVKRNTFNYIGPRDEKEYTVLLGIVGQFDPTDNAQISDNIFNLTDVCEIECSRLTPYLSENTIYFDNEVNLDAKKPNNIGFSVTNSLSEGDVKGTIYQNNEIISNGYDDELLSMGFYNWAVQGVEYCNNITNYQKYGMVFSGNCNNTQLIENKINHHDIGILIRDASNVDLWGKGIIGPQKGPKNEWLENSNVNYSIDAARYESTQDISFSQYFLAFEDDNVEKYDPANKFPSSGWFIPAELPDPNCADLRDKINKLDSLVIESDPAFTNLPEPHKFSIQKQVLTTILEDPFLSTTYSSYLLGMEEESVYQIANARVQIKKALQMNLNQQKQLDSINDLILYNYSNITPIDNRNYSNVDTITFIEPSGLDTIIEILEKNYDLLILSQAIKDDRMDTLKEELIEVSEYIDEISPRTSYEDDYKNIYSLFIKKIIAGDLSDVDYGIIEAIASNEQDSTGSSLLAYNLFNPCVSNTELIQNGYALNSNAINSYVNNVISSGLPNESAIVPNVEFLDKICFLNNAVNHTLEIYDITGKLIYSHKSYKELEELELEHLFIPGFYAWRLIDFDNNVFVNSGIIIVSQ